MSRQPKRRRNTGVLARFVAQGGATMRDPSDFEPFRSAGDASGSPSDASSEAPSDATAEESAAPQTESLTDRISEGAQNVIKAIVGSNRKPPRLFKSLLNGAYLGHPLHPVLTDVPVTAWLIAAIFDIIWLFFPDSASWAARGAQAAVLIGFLGALGAVATGLTDWSDTYGHERSVGFLHGLLNSTATLLYLISLLLRYSVFSGTIDFSLSAAESVAGAIVGFVGLAFVLYAAYLGGDLVFAIGTGVNHTAFEPVVEEFERVASLDEVPQNATYKVVVAGVPIILMRMGTNVYALGATCTHAGGPLDEGELQGDAVQCPWHGSRFNVKSGRVLTGPATVAEPRYDTRVRDGYVEIKRH
jgi:nitrite reductase/ring-hydroxylating ferredoxin subunit/uncharacterized membrane protein